MFTAPQPKTITRQEAEREAALLSLQLDGLTEGEVHTAYRHAIRLSHPDMGASYEDAAWRLTAAQDARKTLLAWIAQQPRRECARCGGSGSIRSGLLGTKPCPSC